MAVFNHMAHKALWDWLAKNPDKQKRDWPEWKRNGGEHELQDAACFACGYATYPLLCTECPLVWPGGSGCSTTKDRNIGLFEKWDDETDLHRRAELAEQIRDLPVREGVECT